MMTINIEGYVLKMRFIGILLLFCILLVSPGCLEDLTSRMNKQLGPLQVPHTEDPEYEVRQVVTEEGGDLTTWSQSGDVEFIPMEGEESIEKEITEYINDSQGFERKFNWTYGGYRWSLTLPFNEETYYIYTERTRQREYDLFASDPYDDELISGIAESIVRVGKEKNLDNNTIPRVAVSFVQSLPYTSDNVTSGFDEYPRFPYETLYENGGDCEDTSILGAAILQEMGYGVMLIELPNHMALGIKCTPDVPGTHFLYRDDRYCYLETTGENWDVGVMPELYRGKKASLIPVHKRAVLDVRFSAAYEYDWRDVYVNVSVSVKNIGSDIARDTKVYVALQTSDTDKVWDHVQSEPLQIQSEGAYNFSVSNLHTFYGQPFRIYVRAWGENVISDEATSDWVTWEK